MLISEIFYSIQGEGEQIGVPSVFVRTSGCNLRCNWCDTPYASWRPERTRRSVQETIDEVVRHGARHVVLTGGEPMMAKGIHTLASALHNLEMHVTVETAGTLPHGEIACNLASISPKLTNSRPDERLSARWRDLHEQRRLQPEIIRSWTDRYPYQLKFVVASEPDVTEIEAFLSSLDRKIPPEKVLLMPEGITPETLRERSKWLLRLCMTHGYRFTPRLHIDLFGNTRGT
ncbi:MAG: 7-carboxy-7-deazaguanine synthase QueE [Opitutales bacterium]